MEFAVPQSSGGARSERAWAAKNGDPWCPGGVWVLPSHSAAWRCTSGAHTPCLSLSLCPPAGLSNAAVGRKTTAWKVIHYQRAVPAPRACTAQGFIIVAFWVTWQSCSVPFLPVQSPGFNFAPGTVYSSPGWPFTGSRERAQLKH